MRIDGKRDIGGSVSQALRDYGDGCPLTHSALAEEARDLSQPHRAPVSSEWPLCGGTRQGEAEQLSRVGRP